VCKLCKKKADLDLEIGMHPRAPRIGIIGSGAIGGFYGLMLARAGFDVHFLLRSESVQRSVGIAGRRHRRADGKQP